MRTFYFTPVVCSIFFFLFFLAYFQRSQIWCLPYFHTCCELSANLECRSEICCTRLAANSQKNCHLSTIAQHCRAVSLQLRHVSTIGKKQLVIQQYLLHEFSQYGERRHGWDWFGSLRHPSKFQRLSHLGFVTAPMSRSGSQPNFAWCLAVSWAGTLYTFLGALAP